MPFQLNLDPNVDQNNLAPLQQEAYTSCSGSADLNSGGRRYQVYFIANASPIDSLNLNHQYLFCQDLFRCDIRLGDFSSIFSTPSSYRRI